MNVEHMEFLVRNAGQRLTPELVQGLAMAIHELNLETYKQAFEHALRQLTAHEGQFDLKPIEAVTMPGGYSFRPGCYEQERAGLDDLQQMYLAEIHGMEDKELKFSLTHPELVRKERAKQLAMFACEHDGATVGYMLFIPSIDTSTRRLVATELHFFIHPAHRRGWLAIRFLKYAERALAAAGVQELRAGARAVKNVSPLYKRLGYSDFAYIHAKVL